MTMSGYRAATASEAEREIQTLRFENQQFRSEYDRLRSQPGPHAIVLHVDSGRVTLQSAGGRYETLAPGFKVEPTNVVRVHPESKAIVSVIEDQDLSGPMMRAVPAVTREGRLDLKIKVGRPGREDAAAILARYLRARPLDGMTVEEASAVGVNHVFAPRHTLYMVRMKAGADRRFGLGDLASGALLAGLVERATDRAIERDRAEGKVMGIRATDLADAADELAREQRMLQHDADLAEFVADFAKDVKTIERSRA